MAKLYEIIFYTASVQEYADFVLDFIDPDNYGSARLFREDWRQIEGSFVKDLNNLGRDLRNTIIIDNSPIAYWLNPSNGLPIKGFYDDIEDKELLNMIPILEHIATVDNIQEYIESQIKSIGISHILQGALPKMTNKENKDKFIKYSSHEVKKFKAGKEKSGKGEKTTFNPSFSNTEVFDDELRMEDINESINEKDKYKNISSYKSYWIPKPKGMLARYNEFHIGNIPELKEEVKSEPYNLMQIGQGSQVMNQLNSKNKNTPLTNENMRYKHAKPKNSLLNENIEQKDSDFISSKKFIILYFLKYFHFLGKY